MICDIDGVIFRQLTRYEDARGWLLELFRHDELDPENHPAMAYVSMTKPGQVRGPHEHVDQADLFCFMGPSTFRLYLWDDRLDSRTRGKRCHFDIDKSSPILVLVPKGVVHAYKNIGTCDGIVFNAANRLYRGEDRTDDVDEIRHENNPDSPYQLND